MQTSSAAAKMRQKLAPRLAKEVLKVRAVFVEIAQLAQIRQVVVLGKQIHNILFLIHFLRMMGNGQPSGDSRWGNPEPAISFTNNGEGNEAPGVGGTFFDASGEEIDGGFGGGGSGARWAAGGAGGYSGLKIGLTEVKGRLAAVSVSKNTKIVARSTLSS
jgi:hypothetical protein